MDIKCSPIISFCVPVFGTQRFLTACLESIKKEVANFRERLPLFVQDVFNLQTQEDNNFMDTPDSNFKKLFSLVNDTSCLFEIIIVDDATPERKDKKLFEQIIKQYKKDLLEQYSIVIKVVEHSHNLGLVEARRSALLIAEGVWCCFVDSDDEIIEDSILYLLCNACFFDADVVHGRLEMVCDFEESDLREKCGYTDTNLKRVEKKCFNIHKGVLEGGNILRDIVLNNGHASFLCGKLFETSLLQKSFEDIPHCYCVMSEDFLIYFFILLHAKRYYGIERIVYKYFIGRGVSSNKEITSLESWNRACTAGSTFAIIFDYLDEFTPTIVDMNIRKQLEAIASSMVLSNVKHLARVIPSLKDEAYDILISYWGSEIVEQAEAWIEKQKKV